MESNAALIQRQLDAYNAKDLDAWLATYSADAVQFFLHGDRIATGHDEIRSRIAIRFAEPDLHARLLSRLTMENVVVDHELITRNFPEGDGTIEMVCVYEIEHGLIRKASFAFGEKRVFVPSTRPEPATN